MAKNHGARQQKRVAKQKAKRSAKRSLLLQRTSKDPATRLQRAGSWPVVQAYAGSTLWTQGMSSLAIARQESEGRLVFAVFLVDVFCLGVKDAFWHAGTRADFQDLIEKASQAQKMVPIAPACLAKIVKGAVEFAKSFGFSPHPDYRHASALLDGIDPSNCPNEFTFGRDGKPFYIQGPNESFAQAAAISQRLRDMDGHFLLALPGSGSAGDLPSIEHAFEQLESPDEDDSSDEPS